MLWNMEYGPFHPSQLPSSGPLKRTTQHSRGCSRTKRIVLYSLHILLPSQNIVPTHNAHQLPSVEKEKDSGSS